MVSARFLPFLLAASAGVTFAQSQLLDPNTAPSISESPRSAARNAPLAPEPRGDILMARKMYREAIDTYEEAGVDSAVILNKIGIAYHQLMELDIARRYYQRAIAVQADYPEAMNNLGTVYYARKKFRRAIGEYKRALKLKPDYASFHANLGTAFFARRNYKDAADEYQKALTLDSDVFEHRNSYGVVLQERTVEERAKFHYYLARTYAHAGMNERAMQYIRKAIEEGFPERKKLMQDPEFAMLRKSAEFQELLKLEPRVL